MVIEIVIKTILKVIENCWMNVIREAQHEYNKPHILEPNDGSDWRRELL